MADLRACYVSFKADLKARHQMHNLQRWYKCNLFLGLNLFGVSGTISTRKSSKLAGVFKITWDPGFTLPQSPILPGFAIDAWQCRGIDAQHLWTTGMWVLLRLGV